MAFQNLRPTVMLVEEAGQVLEAHILGSLVPSIEHLIMIGDPLQLRPTINNYCEWPQSARAPYSLSLQHFQWNIIWESKSIGSINRSWSGYLLRASLCRSSTSKGECAQIFLHLSGTYSIIHGLYINLLKLPRPTLYKSLQDHECVMGYPPVRGIAHNLFFIDHSHPERGGGDDAVSKYNEYEVGGPIV